MATGLFQATQVLRTTASPTGDWLRALEQLRPTDDATRRAIANLLGLDWKSTSSQVAPDSPTPPPDPLPSPQPGAWSAATRSPALLAKRSYQALHVDVVRASRSEARPEWLDAPLPLDAEAAVGPAREPLLKPATSRHVLAAASATTDQLGALDLERIIAAAVRRQPLTRVPRLPRPTLARGLCLLIDTSDTMVPFADDQDWVASQLLRLFGARLQTFWFRGCPTLGVHDPRRNLSKSSWRELVRDEPLWSGRPVLLLTDLGIGGRAARRTTVSPEDWLDFAADLHKSGNLPVALVPYSLPRCDARLRRVIAVLPWDRSTHIGTVRRAERARVNRSGDSGR